MKTSHANENENGSKTNGFPVAFYNFYFDSSYRRGYCHRFFDVRGVSIGTEAVYTWQTSARNGAV